MSDTVTLSRKLAFEIELAMTNIAHLIKRQYPADREAMTALQWACDANDAALTRFQAALAAPQPVKQADHAVLIKRLRQGAIDGGYPTIVPMLREAADVLEGAKP